MPTVRLAVVLALLVSLAAVPGTALGHSARAVSANTMKLSSAVRMCSAYTPKAEARLKRIERQVLGGAHAAEHARSRAQGRRQACAPGGKLKRGFVAKVRKLAKSRTKRSHATGPPSVVGQWSGLTHSDVTGIHGVLLPTGKVLYFSYGGGETGIASIWDPVTNTSHRVDPPAGEHSPHENIWCGGQTLLADGRVLVVGGNIPKTNDKWRGLDTIYLFDPWTETWTLQGRMREGRWYPTATLLPNNQVVITSGYLRDGSEAINPDVEVFTPNPDPTEVGTITKVGEMSWNLYPRQNVVKDGRVLVSGPGAGDTGLLNPADWTWSSVPRLADDHFYGGAVLLPSGPGGSSQVMVIAGDQSSTTEVLDTTNLGAGWSFRASLPQVRRNANSVLTPDGAVITIGGNAANNFDSPRFEALRYDPAANTWTELAAQAEPRGYHSTALLLPDGRIVSAGDDGPAGGGGQSDEIEVFSPPYLFKGARPTITSAPTQVGFGAQFTVGSAETNVTSAVLVAPGATTHAFDMHQRLVPLSMSPVSGGYALTAPASANIAPPGYYMLFLVDSDGVPSMARMIRLGAGQADGGPPSVAVSAPAAGATVSGTTAVSANASDDIGVVGVQFTLDGANLGAEDTSAPYSVSWNTTAVPNGSHTLRAIARDAAGNSTTSAAVAVTVSNTTPPPSPGLVAAYGFEEASGPAVTDSSGLNNAGTIINDAARTAAGKIGRAIDFDGVNDYVSVADANSLDLTTGMTLEAWVQLDTVSAWRTAIFKEKPGSVVYDLYATNASNSPQGEARFGSAMVQTPAPPALTAGVWTHLAVTYDGAALRVYRNGTQAAATARTGAIQTSTGALRIGGNLIWGEYLDGRIDEVRVYNRALSAGEISADMTRPVASGTPPPGDGGPPSVAVSAPAAGATVSGTTPVSANASDDIGVVGVQFTLDGANLGAEDTSAPYSVSWNTTAVPNGSHTLRAIARDAAGNSTTSAAVAVTVSNDGGPPSVAVSAPAAGATVSGTTAVSANASDDIGVVGVQFTLDGANLGAEDTSAPYSVSWNTTAVPNGSHTLRAIARDAAGNSTTSAAVAVTVSNGPADAGPPSVAVSAPAAGATVSGTTAVSANASDDIGVVGVQFTLDGANLGAEDTSAPYSVSWNTTAVPNGSHTLRAIARDAAGNSTTSAAVAVTVSNTTPPPSPGLVAAYGFEEASGPAVTDSSGLNNAGTIINDAARTAAGKIGRAIDFDGVNDYVSVADANSLDLTTGMTLEAWVQLDTVSAWRTAIFKEKPGSVVYDLYATNASNSPQGEARFGSAMVQTPAPPALTAGVWTHLAVTYDGAALRVYRNGTQAAATARTGAIQTSTGALRIGGNLIWGEYLDGRIDEVRVYNRALSAGEISADMTRPVV